MSAENENVFLSSNRFVASERPQYHTRNVHETEGLGHRGSKTKTAFPWIAYAYLNFTHGLDGFADDNTLKIYMLRDSGLESVVFSVNGSYEINKLSRTVYETVCSS